MLWTQKSVSTKKNHALPCLRPVIRREKKRGACQMVKKWEFQWDKCKGGDGSPVGEKLGGSKRKKSKGGARNHYHESPSSAKGKSTRYQGSSTQVTLDDGLGHPTASVSGRAVKASVNRKRKLVGCVTSMSSPKTPEELRRPLCTSTSTVL